MIEKTLNLAPRILPPIDSGLYTISVEQVANIDSCKLKSASLDFRVQTDRIAMNAGEVYSVYPPKDSAGLYGECLPHIVLHRRTLPWEHLVRDAGVPWIALLVIADDERGGVVTMPYSESRTARGATLRPTLGDDSEIDPEQECQVLTIPYSLFADILPVGDDLPFLAHARGVNLDNKVTDPAVKDNWFSCVIANRYPAKPAAGADANATVKHTAYLVSLEGYGDYVYSADRRTADAKKYDNAQFYVLFSWSFLVKTEGDYNFFSLANLLSADTLQASGPGGVKSAVRAKPDVPAHPPLAPAKANADAIGVAQSFGKLLNLGFVPLNHYFREGSVSISWYHSPFLPQKTLWVDHVSARFLADQLLEYDPELGMFDIRMAAAWQIGRLMALQDRDFSRKLFAWRLSIKAAAVRSETLKVFSANTATVSARCLSSASSEPAADDAGDAGSDDDANTLCKRIWRAAIGDLLITSGIRKTPSVSPRLAALLPSKVEKRGVLGAKSPEVAKGARAQSQADILALLDSAGNDD